MGKVKALAGKGLEEIKKLKELIDAVKGHKDVKTRIAVLSDPENLDTMSVLSREQAGFLSVSNWLADRPHWGLMFQGLKEYAQSLREPSISIGGKGREDAIRFAGALSESKFLSKLGINLKEGQER